jgi:hypothetical protein
VAAFIAAPPFTISGIGPGFREESGVSVINDWVRLGAVAPSELEAARLELHWAVQAVGMVGKQLLEPAPDHSHGSLEWLDEVAALAGQPLPDGSRVALRPASQELLVLKGVDEVSDRLELRSHTFEAAAAWVHDRLLKRSEVVREADWAPLAPAGLPDAPVGHGAPFSRATSAHEELARWFGNMNGALRLFADREPEASQVRGWPHHFDLATLISLDAEAQPEEARSVSLGLSPGDGSIAEPYLYVLPWPAPDPGTLPPLEGGGSWVTEGWVGAALAGSDLVASGDAAEQAAAAMAFFESGLARSRELLGVTPPG